MLQTVRNWGWPWLVVLLCWPEAVPHQEVISVKMVKARKCRLSAGSLVPVLVTSKWKYGWLLHINRFLIPGRIVENSEAA